MSRSSWGFLVILVTLFLGSVYLLSYVFGARDDCSINWTNQTIHLLTGNNENSSRAEVPSQRMIRLHQFQASERRNTMSDILNRQEKQYGRFYNTIVPEVFCDEMVRIGTTDDGGKWMCSPYNMPDDCVVLSLGLSNLITFDLELQNISEKRCRLIGFDRDTQNWKTRYQLRQMNAISKKATIGTEPGSTIADLIKQEGLTQIEILKIDIESAEFTTLIPFLEQFTVSQILIEVHAKTGAYQFVDILNKMAKLGYWVAAYEINGHFHQLSEFTLIHQSRFERYQAKPLAQYMLF